MHSIFYTMTLKQIAKQAIAEIKEDFARKYSK